LAKGEEVYYNEEKGSFVLPPFRKKRGLKRVYYPKVGIYVGRGASHSWLWFIELLDRIGFYDLDFIEETNICTGSLDGLDIFLLGGGDTFAIAKALGEKGANRLRKFIERGGSYVGSCAGAYLLLDLSGPPFIPFSNFTKVQMANTSESLPECKCMPTKFFSSYNGEYVIHPVRESVVLKPTERSFFRHWNKLIVPLYGGPSMVASKDETVLAHYCGFTDDTMFLAEKDLAERMIIGKAAAIKKHFGKGVIWLFGPHFEHPKYQSSNSIIAEIIYLSINDHNTREFSIFSLEEDIVNDAFAKGTLKTLKREISNARIMALGLESNEVHWIIGKKSYDPEKIRVFLETIWRRLPLLVMNGEISGKDSEFQRVTEMFCGISRDIKALVSGLKGGKETTPVAERMFSCLKKATACFLDIYFKNKCYQVSRDKGLSRANGT